MQTLQTKLDRFAQEANQAHAQAQDCFKRGVAHAESAGQALLKAKAEVGHGDWTRWLADHFDGSERTAQLYMRLARRMPELDDEIRNAVADLSLREAAKEVAQPQTLRVQVREMPIQIHSIRVTVSEPEPVGSAWKSLEPPPARTVPEPVSISPTPHRVETRDVIATDVIATDVVAYRAPAGAQVMLPHLAALIAHSRTQEPGDFALALASNKRVNAAELDRFTGWLGRSARELSRIAATGDGCADDAEPSVDG